MFLLPSFLPFLIFRTTVQPIQVIIINSVYFPSSIVIYSFSYHPCVVYCWPVCSHWLNHCSLVLKLVPRCVRKFPVGSIQTWHAYLLPPLVCGRLWKGWRLVVHTCLLQLISLLDIKSPSSSSLNPYSVGFWLVCIIFIGSE